MYDKLADVLNRRFSRLGQLSGMGQASAAGQAQAAQQMGANVGGLLQNIGEFQAGGILAGPRAQAQSMQALGPLAANLMVGAF